jgi:hypothetical protein
MRLPLIGGSYTARSIIANAQRCINLFPEANQKDAPVPLTHYQRPGFRQLVRPPVAAPCRGLYRASNGNGYCVIGANVYSISANWVLTQIGQLAAAALTNNVAFIDNGITLVLADNSGVGYQITLATNAFAQIVDPTNTFVGATTLGFLDTFILWNLPGTNAFGSTLSNEVTFDALYTAGKISYPDPLVGLAVCRREIFLLGALKSEIWFDAGNAGFPFAELPGASFEHGCAAPYSIAQTDVSVFWLGQDLQGQGIVYMGSGYQCTRVSTHALEFAMQGYAKISDAIAYTYQQGGHVFYVLIFPTGNATWAYDISTGLWAQRCWTDANGNLNRDRSNCAAFINGVNVVGDWQNGTLYAMDQSVFTDTVGQVTGPISYIRTFPHISQGMLPNGQLIPADGKRMKFSRFIADMECGEGALDINNKPPSVGLRYSSNRGKTFGETVLQSAGEAGKYETYPLWSQLGIGRDVVFELSYSFAAPAALNGAWVDATVELT